MSQNSTIHVHEDVLESDAFQIDQNASETDFGKYFQSIAENETMYSVCMVKDCSRRFSGNVESLKTHLNVAHNMIFNSTAAMCSNLNDKSADETASACDTGENVVQMQANEADVRKYFQLCQQHDGSLHSKCLIENCSHILAGNHKANLQRHAMRVHKMTFKPWSRKKLDVDAYVTAALQSSSDDSSDSDMLEMESYLPESVDVRQYFRIYHADDGKTYSECNRCKRKLAGNHKGNLMRHLIDGHHMRTNRMPGKKPRQDPRKYFQTTTIDGVLFSRCLIKDCNVRLAGNHILNLERHLKKEHSGVDEILPDTALISDETREIASSTASPLSGQKLIDGSIQQGANQDGFENENPSMQQSNCDVRKFFQRYMENDDIYNICLINRCNRRLTGNHKGNLMRHLVNAHNVNLYTMSADGPLEVAEKADSPEPAKKGTIRGLKPPVQRTPLQIPFEEIPHEITNAYEFFETIVINGKTYSQCLVNDCKRRMAGKHKGNLLRHLRNAHNMHVSRLHRHISKPRRKIKQLARDYYRLVVVNEIVYSDCMIDNCTRRLSGNHLGNLARHLVHAHKINVYGESEDGCHADESSMENFVDSFNEDSSESDPIRDDKSTAHQLPSSVSVGDLSTDHNAEDYRASDDPYQTEFPYQNEEFLFQEDEGDVDDAQDYYRTVVEDDGQIYSECLIVDCDQRMAGKDRDDLMRHLCQVHDIIIEDRRESTAIHTCRLCFEEKHDVVDVSTKNIDGMIRMHFPSQFSKNDLLPNFVCTACWMHLSDFHKFYLTAIDAKSNYFSKNKKKDSKKYSVADSVTDIDAFKIEPDDENLHFDDGNEEHVASETMNDKRDFADAFCKALAADKTSSKTRNIDVASVSYSLEDSGATNSPIPQPNSAESTELVPFVDKFQTVASNKRSAGCSETSSICEYCGILMHSTDEAQVHYTTEHSISREKRIRIVE